jgi:hypothetical protein
LTVEKITLPGGTACDYGITLVPGPTGDSFESNTTVTSGDTTHTLLFTEDKFKVQLKPQQ